MSETQQILGRLIEARKAAGLTQIQAAKHLSQSGNSKLSKIESGDKALDLPMFLKMCEIYDISPVWALTGINPDFDENAFDMLTQGVNASLEDICNLKDTLKRLSYGGKE